MTLSLWVDPTSATCSVSVIMFLDGFSLRFQIPRSWPEVSIRAEMGNWKQPGGTPLLKTSQQQETFALEEGYDPRGLLCCYYNKPQKYRQISAKGVHPQKKNIQKKSDVEELVSLTAPRSRVAPCSKQEKKKAEKTVVTNSCFSIFTHTTKLQPYMG